MSKNSDRVKKWRKATKQRMIQSMGGKCCCCFYSACSSALALHHLDPAKKDLELSSVRANPKSWIKITDELKKCVLVCHNCHQEIHSLMRTIPDDAPKFDETFTDYKLENIGETNDCPVCFNLKPIKNKYCSIQCSAKSKYKVDWPGIDLEKELQTKTYIQISEELGCSDAAVHKRAKRLGIK